MYRAIFNAFFARLDAERAHHLSLLMLRLATALAPIRSLLRRVTAPADSRLEVHALGRVFPSPLGVAAGLDKDARSFRGLWALGFGYIEVGTITASPQTGAVDTRIYRLPKDRALVNRMGFPNPGAVVAAARLRRRDEAVIVGVNVGKSKDASQEKAGEDYRASVREVAPAADYLVINVSSPNTPGLRDMQAVELLRPLIRDVRQELRELALAVPLLVKVAPDLSDDQLDAIADLAVELGLDGLVAVNTTIDRSGLDSRPEHAALLPGGGISGAPLKARSLGVLRRLRSRVGTNLILISVGGIETPGDAWERILAGATLVQAYTGFVYGGPAWPRKVNRELARRVQASGRRSIEELVGTETASVDRNHAGPGAGRAVNDPAPLSAGHATGS